MELCNSCIEKLRSAYTFKYDCLSAEKAILKYLQENQLLEDFNNHSLEENSDVTLLPKPPDSEGISIKSNKNGDTAQKTENVSVKNENQHKILGKTVAKPVEILHPIKTEEQTNHSLLQDCSNSDNSADESEQTCEPEVVSKEVNIIEQANLTEPPELIFYKTASRTALEKGLNIGKCSQSQKNITPKQGNILEPSKTLIDKATGLSKEKQYQQSSTNTKNLVAANASNNPDETETENITQTNVTQVEEIRIHKQKNVTPGLLLSETTNTACKNGKASQGEVVTIKQENVTIPSELTFCDATGLFKNNQNQYFNAEGTLIEPHQVELEAQKALEKVNSIFTEPINNRGPVEHMINNKPVQVQSLGCLKPVNAGILTPVTVTENNGVLNITPVGDAVKNSFITLDNPFMMDDMIDIKEEPLDTYDFDTIASDEDTISAPETMLQDCQFGGTDEYIDIPEFVMVNKKGEDIDQNLEKMQPAVLERKLFGGPGVSGQPRKRTYKKLKMVAAYEQTAPEGKVQKSYSTYPIRKQHPSFYSNEYLASFFAKNGDYTYDHDYISNMYHNSVAIVLDSATGKKLWFCRLCNNQQWTLKHGEHMLEMHEMVTRCVVCNVDMRSSFALNLHVERHTEACRYCGETVAYGARQAHARKHQTAEHTTFRPRASKSAKHQPEEPTISCPREPEPTCSPALPSSNSAQDEVGDTSQGHPEPPISGYQVEDLFYKTDESLDSPDDTKEDVSYSPTPQKRQLRTRRRKKGDTPPAVEPSGRLLRSHMKKSQEGKEGGS
nr:unnamed protein product [Callosobruchus analis]